MYVHMYLQWILDTLHSLSDVTVFLADARGLTAAIHNTGSVYEEIGNLHGGQVSSVLVCVEFTTF